MTTKDQQRIARVIGVLEYAEWQIGKIWSEGGDGQSEILDLQTSLRLRGDDFARSLRGRAGVTVHGRQMEIGHDCPVCRDAFGGGE